MGRKVKAPVFEPYDPPSQAQRDGSIIGKGEAAYGKPEMKVRGSMAAKDAKVAEADSKRK